jgi:hypothetical protein
MIRSERSVSGLQSFAEKLGRFRVIAHVKFLRPEFHQ